MDARSGRIADHLDQRNVPDTTLRPNGLFALDLVEDETVAARAVRGAWEALVYPWGVATLDQRDPFFHPYHVAWEHYPKDEAYHNGTVWPWLDGIAMQRMIEYGRTDLAWRLFQSDDDLALRRGVVGGLTETMDAYPHPGEPLPRLTGAFLQAWSNAEHLRVWYQYVLGIRPDLANGAVLLAPRLPTALGAVDFTVRLGAGSLRGVFERVAGERRYTYVLAGQAAALALDVAPYEIGTFQAAPGDSLVAEARGDGLHARLVSAAGDREADGGPGAVAGPAGAPGGARRGAGRDAVRGAAAHRVAPGHGGGVPEERRPVGRGATHGTRAGMTDIASGLVYYVVFLFSTVLHEAAHALAAKLGGDLTAYHGGQVTLDPRPHVKREPFGMVVLPLLTSVLSGWPLGYASAPYDPRWALRYPKRAAWMALAGPGANLAILVVAALGLRLGGLAGVFYAPPSVTFGHLAASDSGEPLGHGGVRAQRVLLAQPGAVLPEPDPVAAAGRQRRPPAGAERAHRRELPDVPVWQRAGVRLDGHARRLEDLRRRVPSDLPVRRQSPLPGRALRVAW